MPLFKFLCLLSLPVVYLVSCSPKQKKDAPPTVLENKKIDVSSIFKKGRTDLVDALYAEVVSNSQELKDLEGQLKTLKANTKDSLQSFLEFNEKSNSYYHAANTKIDLITDSILRKRLRLLISKSRLAYNDSISAWISLDSTIARKSATIQDLYTMLKLVKTLPLLEEFQRTDGNHTTPATGIIRDYDSAINKIDSLLVVKPDTARKK